MRDRKVAPMTDWSRSYTTHTTVAPKTGKPASCSDTAWVQQLIIKKQWKEEWGQVSNQQVVLGTHIDP